MISQQRQDDIKLFSGIMKVFLLLLIYWSLQRLSRLEKSGHSRGSQKYGQSTDAGLLSNWNQAFLTYPLITLLEAPPSSLQKLYQNTQGIDHFIYAPVFLS